MTCSICNKAITKPNHGGTGYGVDADDNKVCYACCGNQDAAYMDENDRITLYLSKGEITNWPGTYRRRAVVVEKKRGHNWGLTRRDAYFRNGADYWWGVQYGENTELCHCRKLKHRPDLWPRLSQGDRAKSVELFGWPDNAVRPGAMI